MFSDIFKETLLTVPGLVASQWGLPSNASSTSGISRYIHSKACEDVSAHLIGLRFMKNQAMSVEHGMYVFRFLRQTVASDLDIVPKDNTYPVRSSWRQLWQD